MAEKISDSANGLVKAIEEETNAYDNEKSLQQNPYPRGSALANHWIQGWHDAERDDHIDRGMDDEEE